MPEDKKSAVEDFFESLPSEDKKEQDIFNDKPIEKKEEKKDEPVKDEKKEDEPEEDSKSINNRRIRRLEDKYQRERESNIALNERLKTFSEIDKVTKSNDGTVDPRLLRVFGATDEGKEVAKHFTEILSEYKESAREEAIREIEEKEKSAQREEKQYEQLIDNQLESLEDQYDVDLTSDSPKARKARREFLELVQKLSPKDESGAITGYADFDTTFDIYQKTRVEEKTDASRQKEIASKSMQRSSPVISSEKQPTPGFRGWEKDYGI